MIPASLMALVVDAPTEDGWWCPVDAENVGWPVEVTLMSWVDVDEESGAETPRSRVCIYYPGREESYDLPTGKRWLRFEALTAFIATQAAELATAQERLAAALERHLDAGPLTWGDVGWDSERPDVVRLGLREAGGGERMAFIPVEKAALVGATAAIAKMTAPKPTKRARKGGA